MSDDLPDYSGEQETPSEGILTRLRAMALEMMKLGVEIDRRTAELKDLETAQKKFSDKLIPDLMKQIGFDEIKLTNSFKIILKKEVRVGAPPQDERLGGWKKYLEDTGNDGMIKRDFTISYGRDSTTWAEEFQAKLKEMDVEKHAEIKHVETVHPSTLKSFLTKEKDERPEVLELFGAYEQTYAKIGTK